MKTLDRLRQLYVEAGLMVDGSNVRILDWLPVMGPISGCGYRPAGLVHRVSGRSLDHSLFVTYPNDTYAGIYGF
jgi:hypothetical protein